MGKQPPKWLPGDRVKETILVQRKSVEQMRADRVLRKDKVKDQKARMKAKMDRKRKVRLATKKFQPAQVILQQAEKREKNARKFSKASEKFDTRLKVRTATKPEIVAKTYKTARIALVIRAKGKMIPQEVKKGLLRMGLTKLYKARLVHLTPSKHRLLQQLRPFTVIGYPSSEQLEHLVRTRGCFWNRETKSKAFISGNLQVEQQLGQHNVLSIEELVDVLVKKEPPAALEATLKALAPFDFHPPRKMHFEKHRRVHQKLEVLNADAFAGYLHQQLQGTHATRTARAPNAGKKRAKGDKLPAGVFAAS